MKAFEALKFLNLTNNLRSVSETEDNSPLPGRDYDSDQEFSFSPDKSRRAPGGLADILSSTNPKNKSKTPVRPKTKKPSKSPSYLRPKATFTQKDTSLFKPSINPKSASIVKNAVKEGRDLHSKTPDKIHPQPNPDEPKKQTISIKEFLDRNYTLQLSRYEGKKSTMPVALLDKVDSQCTFAPVLDANSRALANTHRVDLYQLGVKRNEEKMYQFDHEKKRKELEELKKCTFKPRINKKISSTPKLDEKDEVEKYSYSSRRKFNATCIGEELYEC